MDILALLVGAALAVAVIVFVSQPLRRARLSPDAESQLDTLLAQRESLYTQIRELDFDHATGKVSDADHAPLRAQLAGEAAEVLRQIDALTAATPASVGDDIEAAVAARRKRKPADADLEAAVAARRRRKPAAEIVPAAAVGRSALTCQNCGKPLQPGDAFCARCGAPVGTQVAR
jgi:hypothetical protein